MGYLDKRQSSKIYYSSAQIKIQAFDKVLNAYGRLDVFKFTYLHYQITKSVTKLKVNLNNKASRHLI